MILIGNQYGNWKVLKEAESKDRKIQYYCVCNCGSEKIVRATDLRQSKSQFCRKCRFKDKEILPGEKFNDWTVLKSAESDDGRQNLEVQCNCGTIKIIKAIRLRFGDSKCCRKCGSTKHGMVHSSTYSSWESMIQRCTNSNHTKWNYYGGKGIKVCDRWLKFENFFKDMGEKPEGFDIDRIDTYGNYEPNNCQWISHGDNIRKQERYDKKSCKS